MTTTEIQVKQGPVEPTAAVSFVGRPGHGAQAFFLGVVRDKNLGRDVVGVDYDCYVPLTRSVFASVVEQARDRWKTDCVIFIGHGYGYLKVGESSVAIGVSTPHRREAFEICRFVIEQIKHRAPIWKQEHYVDGKSEWVKGHSLCQRDHGSDFGGGEVLSHETEQGHAPGERGDASQSGEAHAH